VTVAAWNVADGMTSSFKFETGYRETRTMSVIIPASGASLGGWATEETTRGAFGSPPDKTNAYHKYRWAEYRYYQYQVCLRFYCYFVWKPHNWTGGLNMVSAYSVPAFKSQYAVVLNGTRGRSSGNKIQFGAGFSLGGVSGKTEAMYDQGTSMTWTAVPGCSKTRYVWGNGADFTQTTLVQASCR
jgi:hypothetical protein